MKARIQSNLPPGYTFCHPDIGFAHASLKAPTTDNIELVHYTEVESSFQILYLLSAVNLFTTDLPLELQFFCVKHHLEEGWYFVDGVVVSMDATYALRFLRDEAIYDRGFQPLEEMNQMVQRIVPKMLQKSGVPSLQPLLRLLKYTW